MPVVALDRDYRALKHTVAVADEERHTDNANRLISHAIAKGWAVPIPGVFGPGFFRVEMTDAGMAEARRRGMAT